MRRMILMALVAGSIFQPACEHGKQGPINTNGKAGVAQGPLNSNVTQHAQGAHATPDPTPPGHDRPANDDLRAEAPGAEGVGVVPEEVPRLNGLLGRVAGTWELETVNGIKWTLSLSGAAGTLRAEFVESGESVVVLQRINVSETSQGVLMEGSGVSYVGSYSQSHNYSADTLLFQPQADGSFRVWERDGVNSKEWRPVKVKAHLPL